MIFIFVLLAFASAETFEDYVIFYSNRLNNCFASVEDFNKNLNEFDQKVDTFSKKEDLKKYTTDETMTGEYLRLFDPTVLDKTKTKVDRACWAYYYEFKKNILNSRVEKHKILRDWKSCLSDLFKTVPQPAEQLISCYEKLEKEFKVDIKK